MMVTAQDKTVKIKDKAISKWNIFRQNTAPSTAVIRPMSNLNNLGQDPKKPQKTKKSEKNEIFVDIFEKLSVLFN